MTQYNAMQSTQCRQCNFRLCFLLSIPSPWKQLVMEKSPVISKARALGLTRALKLITRAFLGFANPIDFTNVMDLIGMYSVQYTILECLLKL